MLLSLGQCAAQVASPLPLLPFRPIFWANRPQSYIERTASWDKFPDTRWGGVNNPCYSTVSEGVLEGSRCGSADERRSMWGDCPIEERDVFEVFAHYVQGGAWPMH